MQSVLERFWRAYAFNLPFNILFSVLSHKVVRVDTSLHFLLTLLILPFIVQRWFGLDFKSISSGRGKKLGI